jgi:ABC-type transport system substrate-binding protein
MSPGMWDQIKDTPSAQDAKPETGPAWYMLVIKSRKPPFDDINFRKAFVNAIDYKTIVKSLLGNALEKPVNQLLASAFPCYQPKDVWKFDPGLALQELAASKYGKDPSKYPTITVRFSATDLLPSKMIQIMQQMWLKNLGISVNLFAMGTDDPAMIEKAQIRRVSDGFSDLDVAQYLSDYGSLNGPIICGSEGTEICQSMSPGSTALRAEYAPVDEAIAKAKALSPNDPAFCGAVNAAEDAILADNHYIPLFSTFNYQLIKPWVQKMVTGGATTRGHLAGLESIGFIAEH